MNTFTGHAPAAPPGRLLYSIREIIALTGMSKSWLYGQIRAGRLRTVMAGDRRLIPADALAEWIDSLPSGPPRPAHGAARRDRAARTPR
jgi:excisionase family DNA binding protein